MFGYHALNVRPLNAPAVDHALLITAAVPVAAAVAVAHGVAVGVSAAIHIAAAAEMEHTGGAAVLEIAAAVPVVAGAGLAHGVAASAAAALPVTAAVDALHERYEVRGQVKVGDVLVNRRVRVYSRASGALIAEADTVDGSFRVHAGFTAQEVYLLPVDLSESGTDWLPPAANRVVPVLAMDA